MHYFFKEGAVLSREREVALDSEDFNHAYRVLRLRMGTDVAVSDGRGAAYYGVIVSIGSQEVKVRLTQKAPQAESPLQVTLLQGFSKGEKMDLVVRQAVELGVRRVVPVITERSIPQLTPSREIGRLERWQKISRSAAAQCRRSYLPGVERVHSFNEVLQMISEKRCLVPWEGENEQPIQRLLQQPPPRAQAVFIFIGPEGGFSLTEIQALSAAGADTVHLGPRILRTETAALACLTLVQGAWGDLGVERG